MGRIKTLVQIKSFKSQVLVKLRVPVLGRYLLRRGYELLYRIFMLHVRFSCCIEGRLKSIDLCITATDNLLSYPEHVISNGIVMEAKVKIL